MKYPGIESSLLEFKKELPKNDQIIKTIIGFCNQKGGKLIIGVDDDGTIVGIDQNKITSIMGYLDKSIFESTAPPIIPSIYSQTIGEKTILIIEVSAGMSKPYYFRSEGIDKGTYVRLGRSTTLATPELIQELQWQRLGRSFDCLPVYQASIDDLDLNKFKQFLSQRKKAKEKFPSIDLALHAYHLVIEEHGKKYPSVAGILLFGKNPQRFFTEAFIIASHFKGNEGRDAISTKDAEGTLAEQYEIAFSYVLRQLEYSFKIQGHKRIEKLEIPEEALREALLNAIVHRNYHISAPIKIAVYQNRIEIFSPGGFPGPLDPQNLLMGITYLRNIAITKVFREMNYIEKLGSGLITIFKSYQDQNLPVPEVIEGANFIKVILPRSQPGKRIMQKQSKEMTPQANEITHLLKTASQISMKDILENTTLSRSTAGRLLQELIKKKVIKRKGSGRASMYIKG